VTDVHWPTALVVRGRASVLVPRWSVRSVLTSNHTKASVHCRSSKWSSSGVDPTLTERGEWSVSLSTWLWRRQHRRYHAKKRKQLKLFTPQQRLPAGRNCNRRPCKVRRRMLALSRLSQIWSESPALFTYHIVFFCSRPTLYSGRSLGPSVNYYFAKLFKMLWQSFVHFCCVLKYCENSPGLFTVSQRH